MLGHRLRKVDPFSLLWVQGVSKVFSNNKVRQKLRDDNILLILDEIITGFREGYGSSKAEGMFLNTKNG